MSLTKMERIFRGIKQLHILLFSLCSIDFITSMPVRNFHATFPCGRMEVGQRCKVPDQYCDVILGSCLDCNEDICRQKSEPSCNFYCYEKEEPAINTTFTTKLIRVENDGHKWHTEQIGITSGVGIFAFICGVFLTLFIMRKCNLCKRRNRTVTVKGNIVNNPTDDQETKTKHV